MYENWKILKANYEKYADEYAQVADWCNQTGQYTIVENGDYYEVVPVEVPEVVEDEQIVEVGNL